jgi:hypothetical protein
MNLIEAEQERRIRRNGRRQTGFRAQEEGMRNCLACLRSNSNWTKYASKGQLSCSCRKILHPVTHLNGKAAWLPRGSGLIEVPMDLYPMDDIRDKTNSEIQHSIKNISMKVVVGFALPHEPGMVIRLKRIYNF